MHIDKKKLRNILSDDSLNSINRLKQFLQTHKIDSGRIVEKEINSLELTKQEKEHKRILIYAEEYLNTLYISSTQSTSFDLVVSKLQTIFEGRHHLLVELLDRVDGDSNLSLSLLLTENSSLNLKYYRIGNQTILGYLLRIFAIDKSISFDSFQDKLYVIMAAFHSYLNRYELFKRDKLDFGTDKILFFLFIIQFIYIDQQRQIQAHGSLSKALHPKLPSSFITELNSAAEVFRTWYDYLDKEDIVILLLTDTHEDRSLFLQRNSTVYDEIPFKSPVPYFGYGFDETYPMIHEIYSSFVGLSVKNILLSIPDSPSNKEIVESLLNQPNGVLESLSIVDVSPILHLHSVLFLDYVILRREYLFNGNYSLLYMLLNNEHISSFEKKTLKYILFSDHYSNSSYLPFSTWISMLDAKTKSIEIYRGKTYIQHYFLGIIEKRISQETKFLLLNNLKKNKNIKINFENKFDRDTEKNFIFSIVQTFLYLPKLNIPLDSIFQINNKSTSFTHYLQYILISLAGIHYYQSVDEHDIGNCEPFGKLFLHPKMIFLGEDVTEHYLVDILDMENRDVECSEVIKSFHENSTICQYFFAFIEKNFKQFSLEYCEKISDLILHLTYLNIFICQQKETPFYTDDEVKMLIEGLVEIGLSTQHINSTTQPDILLNAYLDNFDDVTTQDEADIDSYQSHNENLNKHLEHFDRAFGEHDDFELYLVHVPRNIEDIYDIGSENGEVGQHELRARNHFKRPSNAFGPKKLSFSGRGGKRLR